MTTKTVELKPKPRKVRLNVKSEHGAQSSNPGTWSSFEKVMAFMKECAGMDHTLVGKKGADVTGHVSEYPGFMFHAEDPYCGIDLDDCRDPATGEVFPKAREIIQQFKSYTELSQSGTDLHIIIKGKRPADSECKKGWLECYDRGRFFIFTGEVFNDI